MSKEKYLPLLNQFQEVESDFCFGISIYDIIEALKQKSEEIPIYAAYYRLSSAIMYNILAKRSNCQSHKNYKLKHDNILALIKVCQTNDYKFGLTLSDIHRDSITHIVYFDIPGCAQISFHTIFKNNTEAGLPIYTDEWDGIENSYIDKLQKALTENFSEYLSEYADAIKAKLIYEQEHISEIMDLVINNNTPEFIASRLDYINDILFKPENCNKRVKIKYREDGNFFFESGDGKRLYFDPVLDYEGNLIVYNNKKDGLDDNKYDDGVFIKVVHIQQIKSRQTGEFVNQVFIEKAIIAKKRREKEIQKFLKRVKYAEDYKAENSDSIEFQNTDANLCREYPRIIKILQKPEFLKRNVEIRYNENGMFCTKSHKNTRFDVVLDAAGEPMFPNKTISSIYSNTYKQPICFRIYYLKKALTKLKKEDINLIRDIAVECKA